MDVFLVTFLQLKKFGCFICIIILSHKNNLCALIFQILVFFLNDKC